MPVKWKLHVLPAPDLADLVPGFHDIAKSALAIAGTLFLFFALSHQLLLPAGLREPLFVVALSTGAGLWSLRWALGRGIAPVKVTRRVMFVIALLAWFNSALHLWLSGDPIQSTNIGIVLITSGIALISRVEFAIMCAVSVVAWGVAAGVTNTPEHAAQAAHYTIHLLEATVLAFATFSWKHTVLVRNLELRREQSRARAAEHRSLLQAQAKAIEAEQNLRRALEADASKSMFLANMSHELRTPLNSVLGFAELIRDQDPAMANATRSADYAGNIHQSGSHLLELINQILDISKASAGALKLSEDSVDLVGTLNEVTKLLSPQAEGALVGLRVIASPDMPAFLGDDLRLRQIVTNVLSNAIKFTPEGGSVSVSADLEAGGFVVRVKDTGVGIAPEDQARIFEPFVQAESGYSKHHQGTGLGLPISRKLVELHGGTISLKSALGQGTCVEVRFPAERSIARSAARKTGLSRAG